VVVAVLVDEPQGAAYYGGQVAAPVFKAVVENALRMMAVPPDLEMPMPGTAGTSSATSAPGSKPSSNRKVRPAPPKVDP
jgi:cell division protein FtsI (penicillin-binding protein 3)